MARNTNLNIVEQERKHKRARELKRAKEQRNKEKLERLSQVDSKKLRGRITNLETKKARNNGRLLIHEQRQLESLQKDLEYILKRNLEKNDHNDEELVSQEKEVEERPIELGVKSIFWDPEWNPSGVAPKGLKNTTFPLKHPHTYEIDPQVESIPIPTSPPPRFFKIQQAQATYESAPDVKVPSDTTTRFVPSAVRNKANALTKNQSGGQNEIKEHYQEEQELELDEMEEFASGEEEYQRKRTADELD